MQFRQALRLDPANAEAHFRLGTLLGKRGRLLESVEHLAAAVQLDPALVEARANLGFALLESRERAPSMTAFLAAIERSPGHAPAHFGLGRALSLQGDIGRAIEHFDRAIELHPEWPEPALRLAWIRATHADATLRDGEEAVRLAEAAAVAGGRGAAMLDVLAAAYAESGRFSEAAETAREALAAASAAGGQAAGPIADRLALYERDEPYRETPAP
jgi:tetratricopeptide (TPR) repeat protein